MNLLRFLQTVDRRFLYAMLLASVCFPFLPFFSKIRLPTPLSPQTKSVYGAIENLPANSFVLFAVDWSASTRGENGPQTEALIRHIMRKRLRFGLIAFDVQGKTLGEEIAKRLEGQYGYKEGVNWVNFGYKVADLTNYLKSFTQDIPVAVGTDIYGSPVATLPVMQGIHSGHDLAFVIDTTGSDTYTKLIQFVQGPYKSNLKMAVGLTSVMAPEAFNYVDSGQLVGVLTGLKGAIEYEDAIHEAGSATRDNLSLSFAHILIILFIVLGNVAMVLERRAQPDRRRS